MGNYGNLKFVAEPPAGFEFGNFLRRHRQMKQDLAMFSPRSEFWRPARDHALGVKNAIASLLTETFFPNPASFFQNHKIHPAPKKLHVYRAAGVEENNRTFEGKRFDIWIYSRVSQNAITGSPPCQAVDIIFSAKPCFSLKRSIFFADYRPGRRFLPQTNPPNKPPRSLSVLAAFCGFWQLLKLFWQNHMPGSARSQNSE